MAPELLIVIALVLANGVLAGAEIAVVALRRTRLNELVERGSSSARAVGHLRDNPEQFLATVQIGITVIGATAGAFGGATFAQELAPVIGAIGPLAPYADEIALTAVVVLISYLSLVLGELVPKSLALRYAESYALALGRPLLLLSRVARPLVWLLTASSNVVLKFFGDRTTFTETRVSLEELQQMVGEAATAGTLPPSVGEIASRALELSELRAHDIMVPRNGVVAISEEASLGELRALLVEHGHSRVPVFRRSIDVVVGYATAKDVLARPGGEGDGPLTEIVRPAFFVPETKPVVELLQAMRDRRVPFAVVVDEQGGTSGIVTMEDLVEELVGEIFSEHAPDVPELIRRQADGSAVVHGSAPVREVNRALELELPEERDFTTVAGLFFARFGRIPSAGDRIEVGGCVLEVVDASSRRIRTLRIAPSAADDEK